MERNARRAKRWKRVRAKSFWDKLEESIKPSKMRQISKHKIQGLIEEREEKVKPIVEKRFPGWQEELEKKVYYGTQKISPKATREQIESFREQKKALESMLGRRRAIEKTSKPKDKPARTFSPSERLIQAHKSELLRKSELSKFEKLQKGIEERKAEELRAFEQAKEKEAEEIRIRRMPIEERIEYLKSKTKKEL
ncbi:MAG: hypothetical protein AB1349_11720 [Elusimicrobiota bacterium]